MASALARAGLLPTLGAAVLWGTSFPAIQVGLRHMEPGFFVAARFALAALIALPFAWRHLRPVLTRWEPWALGAINAAAFFMQHTGQTTAPAGAAGLLVNASVVLVALFAWIALGERPTAALGAALVLALGGVGLIVYEPGDAGLQLGHVLVFGAGATWAVYMVGTRASILRGFRTAQLALAVFLASGVLLSPLLVLQPVPTDPVAWAAIAYTAVACTLLAFLLWLRGLEHVGATASAVTLLLEVFVAAAIGAALLGEAFGARKVIGGIAIGGAILVIGLGGERETPPATAAPDAH